MWKSISVCLCVNWRVGVTVLQSNSIRVFLFVCALKREGACMYLCMGEGATEKFKCLSVIQSYSKRLIEREYA